MSSVRVAPTGKPVTLPSDLTPVQADVPVATTTQPLARLVTCATWRENAGNAASSFSAELALFESRVQCAADAQHGARP